MDQQFNISEEVIRYSAEQRKLYGSLYLKALKFVNFKCIHYISDKHLYKGEGKAYIILPLNLNEVHNYKEHIFAKIPFNTNYNFTAYIVTVTYNKDSKMNFLHCNCQGWKDKDNKGEFEPEGVMCSHSLALKLYWKAKYFENKLLKGLI